VRECDEQTTKLIKSNPKSRPKGAAMSFPTADDHKRANKSQDDAIAALVSVATSEPPQADCPRYREAVYKAAWKVVEACQAVQVLYDHKIKDIEEYNAEIERRRQIGLTIDPATAETMFWYADLYDPYRICDEKMHIGQIGRERFARHPDASWRDWVNFDDLPEAIRNALWERDGRKLAFPYGLSLGDDVIIRPPKRQAD
jgi:hypothetical protein